MKNDVEIFEIFVEIFVEVAVEIVDVGVGKPMVSINQ